MVNIKKEVYLNLSNLHENPSDPKTWDDIMYQVVKYMIGIFAFFFFCLFLINRFVVET